MDGDTLSSMIELALARGYQIRILHNGRQLSITLADDFAPEDWTTAIYSDDGVVTVTEAMRNVIDKLPPAATGTTGGA